MEIDSFSLSPGIWWHLLFCQLRFKLDSSICHRHPEACVDPEDKGDCFNYFPWMAYLALASAWGKTLGARCMQPCNYAFKSIFLINLNMLEKLTWLDSEKSCGLVSEWDQSPWGENWSHLSWGFERCFLVEEIKGSKLQNLEKKLLLSLINYFILFFFGGVLRWWSWESCCQPLQVWLMVTTAEKNLQKYTHCPY